jgi:hypothetical protein
MFNAASWEWPLMSEMQLLLRSLKGGQLERLLPAIFGDWQRGACPGLQPTEFLLFCAADWFAAMTPVNEMEQSLLLREFRGKASDHTQNLLGAKEDDELPQLGLGLYNFKYASWLGSKDNWWDIKHATWLTDTPEPPIWTTVLHMNNLWFVSLEQLRQLRKVRSTRNGRDAPTTEDQASG